MPRRIMYISMGGESNEFARERIRIPIPAWAPVDSATRRVVRAADRPRRMAVMMKGMVAGQMTFRKISRSLAPKTRAALIRVVSMF